MKVRNMKNSNGNEQKNQFIITDDNGNEFFQSYRSIIVKRDSNKKVYLDEKYWDFSATTNRYRVLFLGENINETRKKIASGEYTLTNLN